MSLWTDVGVFLLNNVERRDRCGPDFCSTVLKFLKTLARIARMSNDILNYYVLPLTLVLRLFFRVTSQNWVPGGTQKIATLSLENWQKGWLFFFETFFPCLVKPISIMLNKKNHKKNHLKFSLFFGRTPYYCDLRQ